MGKPETLGLLKYIKDTAGRELGEDAGISIKPITAFNTARIVKFAFDYARQNGRKRVTAITKANIMKHTDGYFYSIARKVAEGYADIQYDEYLIDALCMQLVRNPDQYDVLVLPNLYGDIISDLGAGAYRRTGSSPGSQPRRRNSRLRTDPRIGAPLRGPEQDQPHGADALRSAYVAPHRRGRRRRPDGERRRCGPRGRASR